MSKIQEGKFMPENNEQTLYEILKISPNATYEEIKIAYRKMAMEYHPDVNQDANDEMMYKINEAYKVLKDTESRRLYDETLRKSGQYQKNNSTTGFDNQNNPTPTSSRETFRKHTSTSHSYGKRHNYYNTSGFGQCSKEEFINNININEDMLKSWYKNGVRAGKTLKKRQKDTNW